MKIDKRYIIGGILILLVLVISGRIPLSIGTVNSASSLGIDMYCSCSSFAMPIALVSNSLGSQTSNALLDMQVPTTITAYFCLGSQYPGQAACQYTQTTTCNAVSNSTSFPLGSNAGYIYESQYGNSNYTLNTNIGQGLTYQIPSGSSSGSFSGSYCNVFLPGGFSTSGQTAPTGGIGPNPNFPKNVGFGYLNLTVNSPGYKSTTSTIRLTINSGGYFFQPIVVPIQKPSTQSGPPPAPIWTWQTIISSIQSFLQSLNAIFTQYFGLPTSIFSVGVSPLGAKNTSYVGNTLTAQVSLAIPANQISTAYTIGATSLVNTGCASYVYQNSSGTYGFQSNIINASKPFYNYSFTYTPQSPGIYIFGASCQTSTVKFSNGAWGSWSPLVQSIGQYKGIAVLKNSTSVTPPPPITITNQNFFTNVQNFIGGIIAGFTQILHNLGIPGF